MSKVWYTPVNKDIEAEEIERKVKQLFEESIKNSNLIAKDDFVAMKIHFGEKNNTGYIRPQYLKKLIKKVKQKGGKPFLTDTNTLYKGQRANSIDHMMQAYEHGFTPDKVGVPVIISDGLLSKNYTKVSIDGKYFDEVNIANDILHSDVLIGLSHLTGHLAACMGASVKNIGMGCASRSGKQLQHADVSPTVSKKDCVACGQCVEWCPVDAIKIENDSAIIDQDICYGCAECITTCQYGAISQSWGGTSKALQEKMAEYALGAVKDKKDKSLFFNFLIRITKDCDCIGKEQERVIDDIGILVSQDPVAIDQAAIDLLNEKTDSDFLKELWSESNLDYRKQLQHAENIGMGTRDYEMNEV